MTLKGRVMNYTEKEETKLIIIPACTCGIII